MDYLASLCGLLPLLQDSRAAFQPCDEVLAAQRLGYGHLLGSFPPLLLLRRLPLGPPSEPLEAKLKPLEQSS